MARLFSGREQTAGEAAEKFMLRAAAPEGASDSGAVTASLKAMP